MGDLESLVGGVGRREMILVGTYNSVIECPGFSYHLKMKEKRTEETAKPSVWLCFIQLTSERQHAGGRSRVFMILKLAYAMQQVPGQPGLHHKTPPEMNQQRVSAVAQFITRICCQG